MNSFQPESWTVGDLFVSQKGAKSASITCYSEAPKFRFATRKTLFPPPMEPAALTQAPVYQSTSCSPKIYKTFATRWTVGRKQPSKKIPKFCSTKSTPKKQSNKCTKALSKNMLKAQTHTQTRLDASLTALVQDKSDCGMNNTNRSINQT